MDASIIPLQLLSETDGDNGPWPDIGPKILDNTLTMGTMAQVSGLTDGHGNLQCVGLLVVWDGYPTTTAIALADFLNAADALKAQFGDPR